MSSHTAIMIPTIPIKEFTLAQALDVSAGIQKDYFVALAFTPFVFDHFLSPLDNDKLRLKVGAGKHFFVIEYNGLIPELREAHVTPDGLDCRLMPNVMSFSTHHRLILEKLKHNNILPGYSFEFINQKVRASLHGQRFDMGPVDITVTNVVIKHRWEQIQINGNVIDHILKRI